MIKAGPSQYLSYRQRIHRDKLRYLITSVFYIRVINRPLIENEYHVEIMLEIAAAKVIFQRLVHFEESFRRKFVSLQIICLISVRQLTCGSFHSLLMQIGR